MFWTTIFFVNWILNILAVEFFAIRKVEALRIDEERDSKYAAFRRLDIHWFNRPWLYMTCHLSLLGILLTFLSLGMGGMTGYLLTIFEGEDYSIKGIRYFIMRAVSYKTSVIALGMGPCIWWTRNKKPKVCYKKYLGPDWVADYDKSNCACVVANHSSFFDIAIHVKM